MLKENKDSKLKNRLKLYFDKPANISEDQLANWYRALSVANGRIGAMVYGGIKREHIQLNEELIWAGPPVSTPRSYQTLGDLYLDFDDQDGEINNYKRVLDINTAVLFW